jgi:hypothetical protein
MLNNIPPVIEVTLDIIPYSKNLSEKDVGRWAVILKDTIYLCSSRQEAYSIRDSLVTGNF